MNVCSINLSLLRKAVSAPTVLVPVVRLRSLRIGRRGQDGDRRRVRLQLRLRRGLVDSAGRGLGLGTQWHRGRAVPPWLSIGESLYGCSVACINEHQPT
jgi:hypothetical protein